MRQTWRRLSWLCSVSPPLHVNVVSLTLVTPPLLCSALFVGCVSCVFIRALLLRRALIFYVSLIVLSFWLVINVNFRRWVLLLCSCRFSLGWVMMAMGIVGLVVMVMVMVAFQTRRTEKTEMM